MLNYETKGSRRVSVTGDINRSTVDVIDNEDWCIVCTVYTYSGGKLEAVKLWDEAETILNAKVQYQGNPEMPRDDELTTGDIVVLYRVGDFNSPGLMEPEKHTENFDNYSWLCLLPERPILYVRDLGNGTGQEVRYSAGGWINTGDILVMKTADPVEFFHNSAPPFLIDRIYPARRFDDEFLVFLPGHGSGEHEIIQTAGGVVFTVCFDGQGNLIDFLAASAP